MATASLTAPCPEPTIPRRPTFTRGSGHNEKALYTERPDDYQNLMERLDRKFETARTLVPAPEVVQTGKSKIGLIAFGSSDFAVRESRDQLKKEYGLETDYLRLRAFPFSPEVHAFVAAHSRVYVIEQNRDGQMLSLLKLDLPAGRHHQVEKHSPLRRPAARRAHRDRQAGPSGGNLMATTLNPPVAPGPRRIASDCRYWIIAGARRRSAPAADTTPFPSASSTPCTRWASPPSG